MEWIVKTLQGEWDLLLPIITFLFGVLITFVITSVNHKRIHFDDIRKTIFGAVLEIKNCASEYWLLPYDEKKRSDLVGSIIFLQHVVPLSNAMMSKKQIAEIEIILEEFIVEIRGMDDDLSKKYHKQNPDRVFTIHIKSGIFLQQYYSFYLEQTTVGSLFLLPIKKRFAINPAPRYSDD